MNPIIDDKYQVISELGRGGMGVVYEAVHLGLGHRVAVKFLSTSAANDEAMLARFVREARAGANVDSEHVAKVFDLGMTEDNAPYIIMELLEGDDLANVLQQREKLRIADAARFTVQAAVAMAAAHAIGVIHRDLKPENMFLLARRGGAPIVKILDFGLAKIAHHIDSANTDTEIVFGTPKYMAPEQLRSSAETGPACDVWALGVILYQMLTGRRPFEGATFSMVASEILTKDAIPVREIRPEIPPDLARIVARCMRRDPTRRPTAHELAELLLPFAPSCGELVRQTRVRKKAPSPLYAAAACVSLLFAAGLGLSYVWHAHHSPVLSMRHP